MTSVVTNVSFFMTALRSIISIILEHVDLLHDTLDGVSFHGCDKKQLIDSWKFVLPAHATFNQKREQMWD